VSGVYAAEQAIAEVAGKPIRAFSFSTVAQAIAVGRFAALSSLDATRSNERDFAAFLLGCHAAIW